jgi:hypothetical protein
LGAETRGEFETLLKEKYNAIVDTSIQNFVYFYWSKDNYSKAHQFKLDVNRIARKKGYMVG